MPPCPSSQVSRLKAMYPDVTIPTPLGIVVSRWSQERFTGGGYSYLRPGGAEYMFDDLAVPEAGGRVLFAGEHTSRDYCGSQHGAYLSGVAAADRVEQGAASSGLGRANWAGLWAVVVGCAALLWAL